MIVLLLLVGLAGWSLASLWPTIAHDGLGVRPTPRSHPLDEFDAPLGG